MSYTQCLNNIRGIAILLVILSHAVTCMPDGDGGLIVALRGLTNHSTVLFVIISGFLFYETTPNFKFVEYISNKIKFVLIPYIFMSIPAIVLHVFNFKNSHYWIDMEWFQTLNLVQKYFYLMITGAHLAPFWFIPMVFILYLFGPLFAVVKKTNYGLIFFFVVSLLLALYIGRPIKNDNLLNSFLYFLPVYILGMSLAKYNFINRCKSFAFLGVSFIATCVMTIIHLSLDIPTNHDLLIRLMIGITIFCICIHFLNKHNKWLNLFARFSFYLFFIHGYFISFFRALYIKFPAPDSSILLAFIAFTVTIFLSFATFLIFKTLLKSKSKVIVGA